MNLRKAHHYSGIIISVFVSLHLFNHLVALFGVERHIQMMNVFRLFYRNTLIETVLLVAVGLQIFSGGKLFWRKRETAVGFFERSQVWTGAYLAAFFLIHVGAVLTGRYVLHLDTNLYFGAAGLNLYPFNLFFTPYYGLAVVAFFGHIAAFHSRRMQSDAMGLSPRNQAFAILLIGGLMSFLILYAMTGQFSGLDIPPEYVETYVQEDSE